MKLNKIDKVWNDKVLSDSPPENVANICDKLNEIE